MLKFTHLNFIDLLVIGYMTYGAWHGWRRGLTNELPHAVFAAVLLVTGFGLWRWTARGISELSAHTFGTVGFVGAMVGAYFILRRLRGHISGWAARKVPDERAQKKIGAGIGTLRTFLLASFVILTICALPIGFLRKPFTHGSLLGRVLARTILPARELVE